jgi:hypothetical protein
MLAEATPSTFPPSAFRCCIRIADISIGLNARSHRDLLLSHELIKFQASSAGSPHPCDIEIAIEWAEELRLWQGQPLFDSGSLWTIHAAGSGYVVDFVSPAFGNQPYKRLLITKDSSVARLILNQGSLSVIERVYALEYPADELLVTNWLAQGRGVEVHGCGLVDEATGGHLFLGHSEAGKSTTTRLWTSTRGALVLSDDRIILRHDEQEIWMHGTPWHGEAGFASPGKARIRRIFVLEHSEANEIIPLTQSQAVGELFARAFPPFHSREPLAATLAYLERIVSAVKCYRYRFRPDRTAVQKILEFED